MICQPCKVDDHGNCTPVIGAVSLGMSDRCSCWEVAEVHVVLATFPPQPRSNWLDEEIRDRDHDTGEDEFDTWIARSQLEMED